MELEIAGSSDTGVRRDHNEDVIWWRDAAPDDERPEAIMIVADGMGGAAAGEVASRAAVERCIQVLTHADEPRVEIRLRQAIEAATIHVNQLAQGNPAYEGMGTTMSVAVIAEDHLVVGHVGDSRCYLIRAGRAQQVTTDHTWVAEEVLHGRLTPEEARRHPNRHVISRSVGVSPAVEVDIYRPLPLRDGDVVLLCSDGLSDVVRNEEVAEYASRYPPEQVASRLIELANSRGGPDNISVVVGRIGTPVAYVPEEETARVETHRLFTSTRRNGGSGGLVKVGGAVLFLGAGAVGALVLLGGNGSGSTPELTASITPKATITSTTPTSSHSLANAPTTTTSTDQTPRAPTGRIRGRTDCPEIGPAFEYELGDGEFYIDAGDFFDVDWLDIQICTGLAPGELQPYQILTIPCADPDDCPPSGIVRGSTPTETSTPTPTPTGGDG